VLTDDALAARLSEGARRWATEHSWPAYAERLVTLYRAAIARNEPRTFTS
jgi:glycosyltransferase involved in cell wall biosynthesis